MSNRELMREQDIKKLCEIEISRLLRNFDGQKVDALEKDIFYVVSHFMFLASSAAYVRLQMHQIDVLKVECESIIESYPGLTIVRE